MIRYLVPLAVMLALPAARAHPAATSDEAPAGIRPRLSLPEPSYSGRRLRLADQLGDRLEAGERGWFLLLGTGNEAYLDEPRQNPDFLYLTGVDVAGAAMALSVGSGERAEVLFLNEPTAHDRIYDNPVFVPGRFDWEAGQDDPERQLARETTGFETIETSHRFDDWLKGALAGTDALFVAARPVSLEMPLTPNLDLVARLRDRYPALRTLDAREELDGLRLVKDEEEIERIEQAVKATLAGFRRAVGLIRPGPLELDIQAEMEAAFLREGAQALAFPTIVASGPRSTVLHYMRNEARLEAGALVVIDAGAEKDGYAADVTRTFPVSGKFTREQRKMYDAVIEAQEAGLRAARPGATLESIDEKVRAVLGEAGYEEGIRHGCCHYVGLEVHDVGGRTVPLAEGMVFTIEPGLYFPESGDGIRVEDTVVMGRDGVRSLSGDLPRRAEDVERFLSRARE